MGSQELIGKTALVTGSSRGIGKAIALALAEAGADVAINYLAHEQEAQDVCSKIKGLWQTLYGRAGGRFIRHRTSHGSWKPFDANLGR